MRVPYQDKAFDPSLFKLAIEHVGSEENQFKFASEMMRVERGFIWSDPCRLFPIDPHLSAPFLHWLPFSWLDAQVSALFHPQRLDVEEALSIRCHVDFQAQAQEDVPRMQDQNERFLLMPKSLYCYKLIA